MATLGTAPIDVAAADPVVNSLEIDFQQPRDVT
jgi:hypothetical protein